MLCLVAKLTRRLTMLTAMTLSFTSTQTTTLPLPSILLQSGACNAIPIQVLIRAQASCRMQTVHLVALPGLGEGRAACVDEVHDEVLVLGAGDAEEEPPAGQSSLIND